MLCKEAMFTLQKGTYMTCVQININNVIYVLVYKQELTVSKEGSQSQGMPAKETTHTAITCTMKAFLTAHGRQLDPALPDGNCLFRALSKQMTGDPSRHAELRQILVRFISQNDHVFGRGWTIDNCPNEDHLAKVRQVGQYGSQAEIKAAASLPKKSIYVATDSLVVGKCMWTAFTPFNASELNFDTGMSFISQPMSWYEIAYTHSCHYDGILPIRTDVSLAPPPLSRDTYQHTITV